MEVLYGGEVFLIIIVSVKKLSCSMKEYMRNVVT